MEKVRNIKLLSWLYLLSEFKIYAAISIIYFSAVSNSYALGSSIFALAMIFSAIFEVPTGILSDFIGRKKTIMLGALAGVIGIALYAIGFSYWILMIGAIFEGLSRSFYSGNNEALLHESLAQIQQKEKYYEFFGKVSSYGQFASAVSAGLGGFIAAWSLPAVMWISLIPLTAVLFISFFFIEPKHSPRETGNVFSHLSDAFQYFLKNRKLRLVSIGSILNFSLGESVYHFQSAFVATIWPLWAVGLANTFAHFAASMSYYVSKFFIKKFGELKILMFESVFSRCFTILPVIFISVFSPLIMAIASLLFGIRMVAENNLLHEEFTDKQRATMSSLNSLASSIFFGIAMCFLGLIADYLDPAWALILIESLLLINFFIYFTLYRTEKFVSKKITEMRRKYISLIF